MKKHLCRKFFAVFFSLMLLVTAAAAFVACNNDNTVEAGPETGMYYYETAEGETYYVTLTDGNKVSMQIKGETIWGTYTLTDGTFAFTLNTESGVEGSYADKTVTVVMDGAQMIFRKTEKYTVTFNVGGGSAVASQKVLNGKSAVKPADPVRAGYAFLGWYADAEYKTAYSFGATPITGDTTVYARWSDKLTGSAVYTVDFDLGYEGDEISAVQTIDGKIYDVPAPSRSGYTFGGWWISDFESADKLTALYEEGYVFDANTTLFALWNSDSAAVAAPAPRISGDSVVWDSVKDASAYEVTVVGPNGNTIVSRSVGATNVPVAFSDSAEGEYKITVTAKTAGGATSETAERYYNNKALARVSLFEVAEPSMLVFVPVDGAEKYTVEVVCGNKEHNHSAIDNGTSAYFDFSGCEMTKDGIAFTVTASAAGRASSVSETFVFKRALDKIENFYFDEATETLSWDAVKNATDYIVKVNGETVLTGGKTSVSLKAYATSPVNAEVTPVSEGYASPDAAVYNYERKQLAAPAGLNIVKSSLTWNKVNGAESYVVSVDGQEYPATTESFDLSALTLSNGVDYEIKVKAVGATESVWSDAVIAQYYSLSESVVYSRNTVNWKHVIGAATYNVKVNDGSSVSVEAGNTSLVITLTQKGENEISVQFVAEDGTASEWVTVTAYAYEISFDSREGSPVDPIYVAAGDTVTLPESERNGFDLTGWYNVPGASAANGTRYADSFVFTRIGDITLYANWSPKSYRASYTLPEGATADTEENEVTYTKNYRLAVPTMADNSKVFIGWYSEEAGKGTQLTDSEGYSLAPWGTMGDATVYAYFASIFKFSLQEEGENVDTYSVAVASEISRVSKVTVPETYNGKAVTIVEGYAFNNCSNLRTIEIPDTIKIIYYTNAFENCSALKEIVIYATGNAKSPLYSSHDGVLYYTSETAAEGKELAFIPAGRTGSIVIPNDVKSIGASAFTGSRIQTVTIPSSVTNIGTKAFENSKYLTDIYFDVDEGDELLVGDGAFNGCTALKSLTIPARYKAFSPTVLGDNASIDNVIVADDHETYSSVNGLLCNKDGDTLIYCPSGRRGALRIPAGIRTIGEEAFKDCKNLTSVVIPAFVTKIEKNAFLNCAKLTTVTFAGGNSLGNALTVAENAFLNCASLSRVTFENNSNVVALGDSAFSGCSRLTSIKLPATVKDMTAGLFTGCANLVSVEVDENNQYFATENNVLYNKAITRIIYYSAAISAKTFVLPETVETIDANLFKGNVSLEKVVIGKNIKEIGNNAFESSAVKTIVFVKGGTNELTIGEYAFASCSALKGIYIADSADAEESAYELGTPSTLRTIGAYAFNKSRLEKLVLSEGLEEIGNSAFEEVTVLSSVSLPSSLKVIGNRAFGRVRTLSTLTIASDSNLETIGKSAFTSNSFSSFTVPKTVTLIDDGAFSSNSKLTDFTFESGRTETVRLGISLFSGSGLTSIILPENLCEITYDTEYGLEFTFDRAYGLKDIQNMPENDQYAYENGLLFELDENGVRSTLNHAGWSNADYVVPNTVTLVREGAFYQCAGCTVSFEAGGTEDLIFEDYVFDNSRVYSVAFPARLKKLGTGPSTEYMQSGMFSNSNPIDKDGNDTTLTVTFEDTNENPARIEELPEGTFLGVGGLESLEIPRSVKKIGKKFYSPNWMSSGSLTTLILHEGLEEIGDYAFTNDTGEGASITSLTIPSTVKIIGNSAFASNNNLKTITFAKNSEGNCAITTLGRGAFMRAGISSIEIPKSVSKGYTALDEWGESLVEIDGLSDYLFGNCTRLSEVIFEDGCPLIKAYGSKVFNGCRSYANVTFPVNLEKMGEWGEGGAIVSITIPKCADEEILKGFIPSLTGVKTFALEAGNENLYQDGENGAIYNAAKNILLYYPACYTAESYTVLDGTVTIGEKAFYENSVLKSVILPDGLIKISENAFGVSQDSRSTALTGISIPSTVQEINDKAFYGAANLKTLTFEKDADGNCALTKIGNEVFRHCTSLEEVELPATLEMLGEGNRWAEDNPDDNGSVFYQCTSLKKVTLPSAIKDIQGFVFGECPNLTTVIIRENSAIMRIADYAFYNSGISSVNLANARGLAIIAPHAFDSCENLASVTFSGAQNNLDLGEYAFANTALTTLNLPASVATIGDYAFYNVSSLATLSVADGSMLQSVGTHAFDGTAITSFAFDKTSYLEEIGAYAFANTAITAIVLPDSVTSIGDYAFYNCVNVSEFKLSSAIENIGAYAFAKLGKITAVTINGNDTVIGDSAFEDCTSLAEVTLESGVSSIGKSAFAFTAITTITLPETITSLSGNPFGGCELDNIEILANDADILFDEVTKGLYNADKTILYYQTASTSGAFVVPEGITSIMPGALAGSRITSVTLPENFTKIESGTFRNCTELTSITIGKNITYIGEAAFEGCTSLESIVFEEGGANALVIGARAFKDCTALQAVEFPHRLRNDGERITKNVKMGSRVYPRTFTCGVVGLGESAFENTGITSITFKASAADGVSDSRYSGNSLSIADSAFKNCAKLEKVELSAFVSKSDSFYVKEEILKLPDPCQNSDTWYLTQNEYEAFGEYTFYGCEKLKTFVFAEEKEVYGSVVLNAHMFENCKALENVGYLSVDEETGAQTYIWPSYVNCIRSYTFANSGIKEVILPFYEDDWGDDAVQYSIASYAFLGCKNLVNFELHGLMSYLGGNSEGDTPVLAKYAFKDCTALKTVVFDDMYAIMDGAFENCSSLESIEVTFRDSNIWTNETEYRCIGKNAFKNCSSLTSVTLEGALENIAAGAFEGCSSLMSIELPEDVVTVAANAFAGWTAEQKIIVNAKSVPAGFDTGWNGNATIVYKA